MYIYVMVIVESFVHVMETVKKVDAGFEFDDTTAQVVRRKLMAAKAVKMLMLHEAQRMRQRQQRTRDHMGGGTHPHGWW